MERLNQSNELEFVAESSVLSHFCQSVCRACGCLPAFLMLCPLTVRAEGFEVPVVSSQPLSADDVLEMTTNPLLDVVEVAPIFVETNSDTSLAPAFVPNSTLRDTKQVSSSKVTLLDRHSKPSEVSDNQNASFISVFGYSNKPELSKDKLTSASPLISEFVLPQLDLATAEAATDSGSWFPNASQDVLSEVVQIPPYIGDPELGTIQFRTPLPDQDTESVTDSGPWLPSASQGEPPQIAQTPPSVGDPELGIIQFRTPLPDQDAELGTVRVKPPGSEIGTIELRPLPPEDVPDPPDPAAPPEPQEPPRRPFLYLSTYASFSSSDNVFLAPEPRRLDDTFIRRGISLTAFPSIGPSTYLLASVDANFLRYQDFATSSYNELRFRAGIRHSFTNRVYGQLSWSTQFLFREDFDNRFFRLDERFFRRNGIELFLGRRDPLAPGLTLDSYYQGQLFFSDPIEFSTLTQSLGVSLSYRFNSRWDTRLGYQLTITDFTQDSRHETSQRLTAQLRYSLSPSVRMSLFGGIGFGRSSESNVSFDNSFFGVSIDATVPLF